MFLKRLELNGFKTFAEKTEVEFPRGFQAVVGPNGSGKSNLTDAIRFCLGEQSLKVLRATRTEELVFAGTATRRAAPFCEVTLVFDNSDRHLPVDFAEVAISRRIERNGDTRYSINRTTCRLKDIHELLMGSGIGPGSFSVLGGREVDRVLSTDPRERRMMLEETAGVNRYRFRKHEAERRLQRTQANLTRLRDILAEVEGQLEESRKQLQRYERYRKAQDELKGLECQVAHYDWNLLDTKLRGLRQACLELEARLEEARCLEADLGRQLEAQEAQKADREAEREASAGRLSNLREEASARKAAYEGLFQRASELEHSARSARERCENTEERIEARTRDLDQLELKRPLLSDASEGARRAVAALRERWEGLPLPGQGAHAELRARLNEVDQELSRASARLETLHARLESDRRRVEEISALEAEAGGNLADAVDLEPELERARTRLSQAEERQRELETAWAASEKLLADARNSRRALEGQRRPLVSRCTELESFLEDRSGMPPAVRAVMAWKCSGTVGLVGELVRVPEGLELAAEAALGGHLNDVVTRDRGTASELIDRLKKERVGRVTFWPLDLSRKPAPRPELPSRQGVVGLALELIGYPAEILPVLEEMLGRTVFMEDLPSALALYDRGFGRRPHLVTLQGEYLAPSGALTGGALQQNRSGLLARRRQLEEARASLQELERRLAEQQEREEQTQRHRGDLEAARGELVEQIRQGRLEVGDMEARRRRYQEDRERAQRAAEKLSAEREELTRRSQQALEEVEALSATRGALAAEQEEQRTRLAQTQEEETRLQLARERVQQDLLQSELELSRRQQAEQDLQREIAANLERLEELRSDREAAGQEEERCRGARQELEREGAELQDLLDRLGSELSTEGSRLEALKGQLSELEAACSGLKRSHHDAATQASELERKL
ncbi:MAG: AAA family ATPase, partial [Candidatus Eremiobacterota bacterium]